MRYPLLALAVVVLAGVGLVTGCGPAPGSEPRVPEGAVRVVPASQVVAVDACEDCEDCAPSDAPVQSASASATEYVKISDWQPSPQVVELEATVAARGDEPPSVTTYPKLTLHRPIAETSVRRFRRIQR